MSWRESSPTLRTGDDKELTVITRFPQRPGRMQGRHPILMGYAHLPSQAQGALRALTIAAISPTYPVTPSSCAGPCGGLSCAYA
ncbi:unnamed protein product [Diplocarpon coronariae]